MQADDHVAVDFIFRRNHHHTTALRSSDPEGSSYAIFVRNQRSLVSGFNVTFKCEKGRQKQVNVTVGTRQYRSPNCGTIYKLRICVRGVNVKNGIQPNEVCV